MDRDDRGRTGAWLESVNVGRVRTVMLGERPVPTAIWKAPIDGPVCLRGVHLDGDDQADGSVHGGPDKAVHAYAGEDLDWWTDRLGREVGPGTFGENLATRGVDLAVALVGERWTVGSAVLEVSQPRVPCYKLGIRMGDPRFPVAFAAAGRPGAYLRVVEEGSLRAGDSVRVRSRPDHGVTIGLVARAYHADHRLAARLGRARTPRVLGRLGTPRDRGPDGVSGWLMVAAIPLRDDSAMAEGPVQSSASPHYAAELDPESRQWLQRLGSAGPQHDDAVEALFELLHRGTRHEANRRRGSLRVAVVQDLDDLARQAADDALAAVLRKLADYRGASRFTTWAWKFAIFEVSAALRRAAWRGRATTMDDAAWARLADSVPIDPHAAVEARELVAALHRSVARDLTLIQREVFVAVVILEVPIDVLAARRGTTRGAIYKALQRRAPEPPAGARETRLGGRRGGRGVMNGPIAVLRSWIGPVGADPGCEGALATFDLFLDADLAGRPPSSIPVRPSTSRRAPIAVRTTWACERLCWTPKRGGRRPADAAGRPEAPRTPDATASRRVTSPPCRSWPASRPPATGLSGFSAAVSKRTPAVAHYKLRRAGCHAPRRRARAGCALNQGWTRGMD